MKFNVVLKKRQCFLWIIPLCFFPPHCFITAGRFLMLSRRDQRVCIDIHPSPSSMKGKSFTSERERHCFLLIQFAPPPLPLPTQYTIHPPNFNFHFYRRKRKWMSPCACVRVHACVWSWTHKSFLLCASSTACGPVCRCALLSGKRTVRHVCVCVCVLLVDLALIWPPGCSAVWSAFSRFCQGFEPYRSDSSCCNTIFTCVHINIYQRGGIFDIFTWGAVKKAEQ